MNAVTYNITMAAGLAMMFAGVGLQFGWPCALWVTGATSLAINFGSMAVLSRG